MFLLKHTPVYRADQMLFVNRQLCRADVSFRANQLISVLSRGNRESYGEVGRAKVIGRGIEKSGYNPR